MSSKPIISFRIENGQQDRITTLDVIASAFLLLVAYVVITCALSFVLKIVCMLIGVEFTWPNTGAVSSRLSWLHA